MALKLLIIDSFVTSLLSLTIIGLLTLAPLVALYFLSLFYFTKGMKYFVARKPRIYKIMNKYMS